MVHFSNPQKLFQNGSADLPLVVGIKQLWHIIFHISTLELVVKQFRILLGFSKQVYLLFCRMQIMRLETRRHFDTSKWKIQWSNEYFTQHWIVMCGTSLQCGLWGIFIWNFFFSVTLLSSLADCSRNEFWLTVTLNWNLYELTSRKISKININKFIVFLCFENCNCLDDNPACLQVRPVSWYHLLQNSATASHSSSTYFVFYCFYSELRASVMERRSKPSAGAVIQGILWLHFWPSVLVHLQLQKHIRISVSSGNVNALNVRSKAHAAIDAGYIVVFFFDGCWVVIWRSTRPHRLRRVYLMIAFPFTDFLLSAACYVRQTG